MPIHREAVDLPGIDLVAQLVSSLDICDSKVVSLMSHVLRCAAQAYGIRTMEKKVAADPHHVHIIVDFKVRKCAFTMIVSIAL